MELLILEKVYIAVAAFFGVVKFLDKFHFGSRWSKRCTDYIRDQLIIGFTFLDEMNPLRFSKWLFSFPKKITIPIYIGSFLLSTTVALLWAAFVALYYGALISAVWLLLIPLLNLFLLGVTFGFLRRISARHSDYVCTLILVLIPILLWTPFYLLTSSILELPNLAPVFLAIAVILVGLATCLPVIAVSGIFVLVMMLKYLFTSLRWIGLHFISAATDPKTDPFTYAIAGATVITGLNRAFVEVMRS